MAAATCLFDKKDQYVVFEHSILSNLSSFVYLSMEFTIFKPKTNCSNEFITPNASQVEPYYAKMLNNQCYA